MADVEAFQGEDEAAAAIHALLVKEQDAPAPQEDDEGEAPAQAEEAQPEPEEEPATEQNTDAVAAEAETTVDTPEQGKTIEHPKVEPQPVPRVQQAATREADPSTALANLTQLNQAIPMMQAQLAQAFPDIRTPDDLVRLASEDPARVVAYNAMRDKVSGYVAMQQQAQAAYRNEYVAAETSKLYKLIPDLADKEKGPAITARLFARAKDAGYSDEQIAWASASDVHLLYQAMQFQEAQAKALAAEKALADSIAKAKEKAKDAPKVQKPGSAAPVISKGAEKDKDLRERFERTGHPDDLAALLAHRGI